jgi:hypothetical protein
VSTAQHAASVGTGEPMFELPRIGCTPGDVIVPTLVAAVALTATNCARSPNDVFFKASFLYNLTVQFLLTASSSCRTVTHRQRSRRNEMPKPIEAGYVDPDTGRVALTLAQFAALPPDTPGYWFSESAEECGMDPWALVDGLDPMVDGSAFDVWFASGNCITLPANSDRVIFVSRATWAIAA